MLKGTRRAVNTVQPYVSGKTIKEVQEEYGLTDVIKLGSNENPYGPFSHAMTAMEEEIKTLYMYPDNTFEDIKKLLATKYHAHYTNFAVAHGAGGMIETVARTFIEEGDEVIIPLQSYGLYREVSKIMGGHVIDVPLDETFTIDVDAVAEKLSDKTKLIWLCNPNNPTGTVFDIQAFDRLMDKISDNTWVILDEAYAEFADVEMLPNAMKYMKENKQIIIIRTFSKAYGLAGARVGYAIANSEVITVIDTVAEPFNANRVGLAGAIATLLHDEEECRASVKRIVEDREKLTQKIKDLGLLTSNSVANFVFFTSEFLALDLANAMMKKGVISRPCAGWHYPNAVRITIGTTSEVERFYGVLDEVLMEMRAKVRRKV